MSEPTREEVERAKALTGYHLPLQDCLGCGGGASCIALPTCEYCNGTGVLKNAPWADSAWSEIIPDLWVGGHQYQASPFSMGRTTPEDLAREGFEVVVSAYRPSGNLEFLTCEPPEGVEHFEILFEDDPFSMREPYTLEAIWEASAKVAECVEDGRKTLVRCHAGMNRSSLIAALAMVQMGHAPQEAIALIRERRTRFALFNTTFVGLILAQHTREQTHG